MGRGGVAPPERFRLEGTEVMGLMEVLGWMQWIQVLELLEVLEWMQTLECSAQEWKQIQEWMEVLNWNQLQALELVDGVDEWIQIPPQNIKPPPHISKYKPPRGFGFAT